MDSGLFYNSRLFLQSFQGSTTLPLFLPHLKSYETVNRSNGRMNKENTGRQLLVQNEGAMVAVTISQLKSLREDRF